MCKNIIKKNLLFWNTLLEIQVFFVIFVMLLSKRVVKQVTTKDYFNLTVDKQENNFSSNH